jgi:hypothetical protein
MTCTGVVSTSGPLLPEDPQAARAAAAQHTASSRLTGNLMCCVLACIMATCFRDEQLWTAS